MKILKKAFLISFIFVLMFCTTVLPTYAAVIEGVKQDNTVDFDNTDILEDLKDAITDKKNFLSTDISVISFMEYCFSEVTDIKDKYGIYFYVYNPQQRQIETDSTADRVLMATIYDGKGNPTDWAYQDITCVDYVDDPESEWYKKLYKFKLTDASGFYSAALSNPDVRSYHVSGIELKIAGNQNATEYRVGMKYTWSGYANGCGKTMSAEKLSVKTEPIDVIELNVHMTDWVTESSGLGAYHQHQVNSVYFAIENKYLEKYGNTLQKIEAEWYQYKLNPMLVTDNGSLVWYFNTFDIGRKLCSPVNESVKFSLFTDYSYIEELYTHYYGLAYNMESSLLDVVDKNIERIPLIFYMDDVENGILPREDIKNAVYDYGVTRVESNYGDVVCTKDREFSKKLFENPDAVDEKGKPIYGYMHKVIDKDEPIKLDNYKSTHSWWDEINDYGLFGSFFVDTDETYDVSYSIQRITRSDLSGDISTNLKIGKSEVEHFKNFVISSEIEDKTVFIFRYSTSDYWAKPFGILIEDKAFEKMGDEYELRQNMCYLDFDIITLTFKDDAGTETILPVVMSPIDIFLNATPAINPRPNMDDFWDWLKKLLLIILGVVVGVLVIIAVFALLSIFFPNILSGLLKGLLYMLSLPFRGIAWLWNLIFDNDEKKNK